jgi:uncharacterized protein (DUF2062 family)
MMTSKSLNPMKPESMKRKTAIWLRQGISPRRLALTLALGFAIGCIPVVGIPTALCAVLALTLRLNYAVMPLQLALIVPFARLGCWLFPSRYAHAANAAALLHLSPLNLISQLGSLAGLAMLAWLVIAVPAVALMTATLTPLLRRVPALTTAEAAD